MPLLPALSCHFHLTPVDVWAMSPDEIDVYLDELNKIAKQRKKESEELARKRRGQRTRRRR